MCILVIVRDRQPDFDFPSRTGVSVNHVDETE